MDTNIEEQINCPFSWAFLRKSDKSPEQMQANVNIISTTPLRPERTRGQAKQWPPSNGEEEKSWRTMA
jgi:hypothetical protein